RWGTYRRHEMGYRRQQGGFNLYPLIDDHPGFITPSGLIEVWSLTCEAYLDNNPEVDNGDMDHFPVYREPTNSPVSTPEYFEADNAFIMTTGARQPVYFHSEHRQLPWCRELWPVPRLEMNPADAERLGLSQGDWVWIESPWGKVREVLDLYYGINVGVVNANHGWWFPEMKQASHGFDLVNINCVMDPYGQDFVCGAATMRSVPVKIYKATAENSPFGIPAPCDKNGVACIQDATDERLKEWLPVYTEEEWNL
ncbi:MAG: molybdopterin dinucleotide-binding protein, partial [Actinobacteria bacterium]|nr:molybdopterin dinucleotide-binding protein [Actinomycetota bacterium]